MIKFGTGGFRAIIGDDFTKANVELLAQGLVNKMKVEKVEDSPLIIGYDRRFLSDIAAKWISGVFAANGIHVQFIDQEAPTPLIMFTVKQTGAKYGMAITASHNPAEYNGVKVFTEGGRDASKEVTNELEDYINSLTAADVTTMDFEEAKKAGLVEIVDPMNDYIDSILSFVDIDKIKAKKLKILLDPMFGVSKTSLQTILLTCRCDVDVINDRHDTLFGGRLPSPSAKTLTRLSTMVVEGGYDLGIATDGDADRIGLIDSHGAFIHPNDILVLLYYYLVKYKGWKGDCVRNIATTHLLDRLAASFGQTCYEVPVGFKWISSKMDETGAIIGGGAFGDNLAPVSDTTICSALTQGADITGVVKSRLRYSAVAAAITILFILFFGGGGSVTGEALPHDLIAEYMNPKGLLMLIPAILTIYLAIKKGDVIYACIAGTAAVIVVALPTGLLTLSDIICLSDGGVSGTLVDGIGGMADIVILCLLVMGMVGVMKAGEGDKLLIDIATKVIRGVCGAELSIVILSAILAGMTGINTPAILAIGVP